MSIINDRVDLIKVLKFRESRGGEIQMQAFGDQFKKIGLNSETLLDKKSIIKGVKIVFSL